MRELVAFSILLAALDGTTTIGGVDAQANLRNEPRPSTTTLQFPKVPAFL